MAYYYYTAVEVRRWLAQLGAVAALPRRGRALIVSQSMAAGGGVWRVSRVDGGRYQIDTVK